MRSTVVAMILALTVCGWLPKYNDTWIGEMATTTL